MKVILHIALLTNVEKPEELQKKYDLLIPTLIKDDKFTILKYDTEFIRQVEQQKAEE